MARIDAVISLVDELWVEREAAVFECLLETLQPGPPVAYAKWTAHYGDVFVSDSGQVRHCFQAALQIVGNHRISSQAGIRAHHEHSGNLHAQQQVHGLRTEFAGRFGEEDAVYALG